MILLTGGSGFLGTAVQRELEKEGMLFRVLPRTDYWQADKFDADGIIHLAGLCGGIEANQKFPASFLRDNVQVGLTVLEMAREFRIPRFINISSACAYPDICHAAPPFLEWQMWGARPHETHAPYGIAKRVVQEMVTAYGKQYGLDGVTCVLANLFGPGVRFDGARAHVVPALTEKIVKAKEGNLPGIKVLGTGSASREFLYVDDAARAIVHVYKNYDRAKDTRVPAAQGVINVGSGCVKTIKEVAETIKDVVGFLGELAWDDTSPDGSAKRTLNSDFIRGVFPKDGSGLSWSPHASFRAGVERTVEAYLRERVAV